MKRRIIMALIMSVGAYVFTWIFLALLSLIAHNPLPSFFNAPLVLMCIAGGIVGFVEGK